MTKDTVPQNYTLALALFDALPVILFGLASWLLWQMCGNLLVLAGGIVCFAAGMLKVLWKIIVVVRKKLFQQGRLADLPCPHKDDGFPSEKSLSYLTFKISCNHDIILF